MKTRHPKGQRVNVNGLTQSQFNAAVGPFPILDCSKIAQAWEAGEDPAEWRAHYQRLDAAKRNSR